MSYGDSPARASAVRAARVASVEAYSPSATTRREEIPVARSSIRTGSRSPDASVIRSWRCREVSSVPGRQDATAVIPARGTEARAAWSMCMGRTL
ncbi:hypothetical protein GCM10017687_05030 [Streptomyces echinatus]